MEKERIQTQSISDGAPKADLIKVDRVKRIKLLAKKVALWVKTHKSGSLLGILTAYECASIMMDSGSAIRWVLDNIDWLDAISRQRGAVLAFLAVFLLLFWFLFKWETKRSEARKDEALRAYRDGIQQGVSALEEKFDEIYLPTMAALRKVEIGSRLQRYRDCERDLRGLDREIKLAVDQKGRSDLNSFKVITEKILIIGISAGNIVNEPLSSSEDRLAVGINEIENASVVDDVINFEEADLKAYKKMRAMHDICSHYISNQIRKHETQFEGARKSVEDFSRRTEVRIQNRKLDENP